MVQLFVRADRSHAVDVQQTGDVSHIKDCIEAQLGVPAALQRLLWAGRQLEDAAPVSCLPSGCTLHLVLRLRGGKGGFGALLRGAGRAALTDNFDACRDLSGRRLRHVEAEQKMAQWAADAKQRELETLALSHLKEQEREAKRAAAQAVDLDETRAFQEAALEGTREAVADALRSGIPPDAKGKRPAATAAGSGGSGSGSGSGGSAGPVAKRAKRGGMLAELDGSDSEDEAGDASLGQAATGGASASAGDGSSGDCLSAHGGSGSSAAAATGKEAAAQPGAITKQQQEGVQAASAAGASSAGASAAAAAGGAEAGADGNAMQGPLDLGAYADAADLAAKVSADRLKAELQRMGLKCGGTAGQRAQRLMLVRAKGLDGMDKKLFAKQAAR